MEGLGPLERHTDNPIFSFFTDVTSHLSRSRRGITERDLVFVRFPMPLNDKLYAGVEEAILRLMIVRQSSHQNHRHHHLDQVMQVHAYQLSGPNSKILLDSASVPLSVIGEHGKWIEFNVRSAVNSWIDGAQNNLGFEIDCRGCDKHGVKIIHEPSTPPADFYPHDHDEANGSANLAEDLDDDNFRPWISSAHGEDTSPALNIITRTRSARGKRSRVMRPYGNRLHSRKMHHSKCDEHNGQKCCRSELQVVFRDLKALDFIIQPKVFDAGYCRGKCPFNYNTASNHAYLQGMLWRNDRKKVPRPCCAPKKLEDLQVLHIDEMDPTKLKVSTWTEMRVLECACS